MIFVLITLSPNSMSSLILQRIILGTAITSITNHRFTSGVVEFNSEYSDGDTKMVSN